MKLLVISHNPLATYDNMGKTLLTLLSAFSPEELCQLYIYPSLPDTERCNSYFRITDKDVLKSFYSFHVNGGRIKADRQPKEIFENSDDVRIYRNHRNKSAFRMLLRDLMWRLSRWFNKDLKEWLREQKPDCIFLAPGNAKFIYDVAAKISRACNIPMVAYICDEYYFVERPTKALERFQVFCLKRKMRKTLCGTAHVITICRELEQLYSAEFGVPATTVMTGSSFPIAEAPAERDKLTSITYMGNIRCNRYDSLRMIGNALSEINAERGTEYTLNIYTSESDEAILRELRACDAIRLFDFVSGKELDAVLHGADILLHTEAFDPKAIDRVKNSVSTKIADCLGSGLPFLAFGPAEVASVSHLLRNGCAFVITDPAKLKESLSALFDCTAEQRTEIVRVALDTARKMHDAALSSRTTREILCKAAGKC